MRKKSEPLLTLSPEDLEALQETTKRIVKAMEEASTMMQESYEALLEATKELNKANAELKKNQRRRATVIRNNP